MFGKLQPCASTGPALGVRLTPLVNTYLVLLSVCAVCRRKTNWNTRSFITSTEVPTGNTGVLFLAHAGAHGIEYCTHCISTLPHYFACGTARLFGRTRADRRPAGTFPRR